MSHDPMQVPTLHGPRVVLRPPNRGELDSVAELMARDAETAPWWGTSAERIAGWFSDDDFHVLVVEESGTVAGVIAFEEQDDPDYRCAGIDIGLLSCCVGRGLGSEALRLLARWLIDERGHHRLTIDPAADNVRAIRAYERVGYRRIGVARRYERGVDGEWHDNLLMDLLAEEFDDGGGRTVEPRSGIMPA